MIRWQAELKDKNFENGDNMTTRQQYDKTKIRKTLEHSCFVKKYKTRAPQWEYDFNTFSAYNSQYIMIFGILQQCWGMLVVLSGHPVKVGVNACT